MKTPLIWLLTCLLFLSSCVLKLSDVKDKKYKVSDKDFTFVKTWKSAQKVDLKIGTSGGDIQTFGYDGDEIEVSFVVRKYGKVVEMTFDQLKEIADINIKYDSSHLEILINEIRQNNISVGFKIKTPVLTDANLSTSGGDINLECLKGRQTANTSGGDIHIKDITGDVDAHTSGGDIELENTTGKTTASTSGGDISGVSIKPYLSVQTSGGDINLFDVRGKIEASTSGGDIKLDQIGGEIQAHTSGGDITANMDQASQMLELETSGGNIQCTMPEKMGMDLNLSADQINTSLTNFSGRAEKDRIEGKMNGGGIPVKITNMGGDIDLNYK